MKDITQELDKRQAVICMNCGKIYEDASMKDYNGNDCSCGQSWFNWVEGDFAFAFWGSPAAKDIAKRYEKEEK